MLSLGEEWVRTRIGHGHPRRRRDDPLGAESKGQGVERFDEPRVHIRASGHELIGGAVQHQDDALRLEASGAFFEAQVDGGGEAAHAADLQVDEHQFG